MKKGVFKNSCMRVVTLGVCLFMMSTQGIFASSFSVTNHTDKEQKLIDLSKQKWQWMAERNVDDLDNLFHKESVFVHMGATMNKEQELETIRSGSIQYKHTEIKEISIRFIDNIAIALGRIRLTAIVGDNEVVNPFMVTEVYIQVDGKWQLASLSFTRLIGN